jgi:hypothetical protein
MTRRIADRRETPYPFGSPEWIENIKKHYLVWPKYNRRDESNHTNERRALDRRRQQLSEQRHPEKKSSMPLITPEERKLIEELYLNDDPD